MKKLVLVLAAAVLFVGDAYASGHHPGKPRKGEIAAGIAAGVTSALFGAPEPPPPPPPQTVIVQQPVAPAPVVVTPQTYVQPVVAPAPVVVTPQPVVPPPPPPPGPGPRPRPRHW